MPNSVILNGITGAHPGGIGNFFGNDLDLQLAGGLFEFSPFSLTDYTIFNRPVEGILPTWLAQTQTQR